MLLSSWTRIQSTSCQQNELTIVRQYRNFEKARKFCDSTISIVKLVISKYKGIKTSDIHERRIHLGSRKGMEQGSCYGVSFMKHRNVVAFCSSIGRHGLGVGDTSRTTTWNETTAIEHFSINIVGSKVLLLHTYRIRHKESPSRH
jgi:hypothetical protein